MRQARRDILIKSRHTPVMSTPPTPTLGSTAEDVASIEKFWQGHGRVTVTVTPLELRGGLQRAGIEERFAAHAKHLPRLSALPGPNVPSVYPDYGAISNALYWGCVDTHAGEVENPHVDPAAASIEDALELTPRPVDDPELHAAEGLELFRRLKRHFGTEDLWFRTPDTQGVLTTAGMIVDQQELLMGMVAEPDETARFLDRVCDWLLELWNYLREQSGHRVCGNIWPHTFLPEQLGFAITEDMMPLLSPELYETFGIPQLRKIENALGPLHIHCCGQWGRHAENLAASGVRLRAVEFHYPYTTIEELTPIADQAVFVPYLSMDQQSEFADVASYYHHLIENTPKHNRYWFPLLGDDDETLRLAQSLIAAAS